MRTALYDKHLALGAKMVDFAGWEMPLHYPDGALHECLIVRERAGLFDVSHMGRILIEGREAEGLLDHLSANKIEGKRVGSVTYTVWCDEHGGSVDDLLVYRTGAESFFIVVNAGGRQRDLAHLMDVASEYDATITPLYGDQGILALQGPCAPEVVQELFPDLEPMKPMRVEQVGEIAIASTGYTGEKGFELMGSQEAITALWDRTLQLGDTHGVEPVGLAARDILRLEMGYALYGHELSPSIAPTESVSAWTVKRTKESFIGKEALLRLEESREKRSQVGLRLIGPGVARADYPIEKDGAEIGIVTSGGHSPTLRASIAIGMVRGALQEGERVEIVIRNRKTEAVVVPFPFIKHEVSP